MELCPKLRNFTGERLIALLAFLADRKDMFDNYGVCKREAVRVLSYLLRDGAKEVCEAFTANEMNTEAYV